MKCSVIILAAGLGKRMRSSLPKVLHPIGGKPMLSHVVDAAATLAPSQTIIVHSEQNKEALQASIFGQNLIWALQETPKGTAHAVMAALPFVPEDHEVVILCGDVPLISKETLHNLMQKEPSKPLALLTAYVKEPRGLGRIIRNDQGDVVAIREDKDATEKERLIHEINTGIYRVEARALKQWLSQLDNNNAQEEYYLTDIIQLAAANHQVTTLFPCLPEEIMGVNDRAQLIACERFYQERLANEWLKEGVTIIDPKRFDVRGRVQFGQAVHIDINAVFEGEVILGDGCSIGPNCVLKNCDIGQDVVIKAFSYLENVVVRNHAVIGPFARLRPGTEIGEHAHVGNFVEIKNTHLGPYSKASHLSYLGDAKIAEHVNIGAGTITCNYDGAFKHETVIEAHAHIGSDTQLVAPVRIGKGATVGAGSTIVQDVPPGELTLTHRLDQRSKVWKRPQKEKKTNS